MDIYKSAEELDISSSDVTKKYKALMIQTVASTGATFTIKAITASNETVELDGVLDGRGTAHIIFPIMVIKVFSTGSTINSDHRLYGLN
tara:strand:+ start:212 stop:478 length:267 start_codon:yes stop_codon:yes gene_type:complete